MREIIHLADKNILCPPDWRRAVARRFVNRREDGEPREGQTFVTPRVDLVGAGAASLRFSLTTGHPARRGVSKSALRRSFAFDEIF